MKLSATIVSEKEIMTLTEVEAKGPKS